MEAVSAQEIALWNPPKPFTDYSPDPRSWLVDFPSPVWGGSQLPGASQDLEIVSFGLCFGSQISAIVDSLCRSQNSAIADFMSHTFLMLDAPN